MTPPPTDPEPLLTIAAIRTRAKALRDAADLFDQLADGLEEVGKPGADLSLAVSRLGLLVAALGVEQKQIQQLLPTKRKDV